MTLFTKLIKSFELFEFFLNLNGNNTSIGNDSKS